MSSSLIVSETELQIMANKVREYGEFLETVVESYQKTLKFISSEAIDDIRIKFKLQSIIFYKKVSIFNFRIFRWLSNTYWEFFKWSRTSGFYWT